jgi:hypothetical protein
MIGAIDTSSRFRLLRGALVRAHTCGAIGAGGTVTGLVPHAHQQSCRSQFTLTVIRWARGTPVHHGGRLST